MSKVEISFTSLLAAMVLASCFGCSKKPSTAEESSPSQAGSGSPVPESSKKASSTTPVGAVTVASITLGVKQQSNGLTLVNLNGDGACEVAEVEGVSCHLIRRQPGQPPSYLYFQLAEGAKLRASEALVMVEYFDATSGEIAVDYDSADEFSRNPGYTRVPTRVALNNDNRWHKGVFVLRQPRFQRTQHDGGDFRVALSGQQLYVRSVQLMQP